MLAEWATNKGSGPQPTEWRRHTKLLVGDPLLKHLRDRQVKCPQPESRSHEAGCQHMHACWAAENAGQYQCDQQRAPLAHQRQRPRSIQS